MAKLRRNHKKEPAGNYALKTGLFLGILGLFYAGFHFFGGNQPEKDPVIIINPPEGENELPTADNLLLPTTHKGYIVSHPHYSLSYVEKHEQPEWVTYYISKRRLNNKRAKRANWFEKDPLVRTGSATFKDYKGSGYDKGHLAPAADMAFSKEAMVECFYMSNMSPQVHNFNGGVWRELEELSRDWGRMNNKIYVVTGPIFKDNLGVIGRTNEVTVPGYYFKILLDIEGNEKKAIGFIMPNKVSNRAVSSYVKTVDEIEKITGIDFFPQLDDDLEDKLESQVNLAKWPVNNDLYKIRKEKWNAR